MPRYDVACPLGHEYETVARWDDRAVPCVVCGAPTERIWRESGAVIGDEVDFVQTNGTKTPIRFRSRQAFQRWCKAHGYRVLDGHVGAPGSDKSQHTSSCSAVTAETLAGAKAMLERSSRTRNDWEGEIGITSDEGLIRYMADTKKAEHGQYF